MNGPRPTVGPPRTAGGRWLASGDPWVWLTAGAVSISTVMVLGLLVLIAVRGLGHFWPAPVAAFTYQDLGEPVAQRVIGVVRDREQVPLARFATQAPEDGSEALVERILVKTGNRDLVGLDFRWLLGAQVSDWAYPEDIVQVERREWGDLFGYLVEVRQGGQSVARGDGAWPALEERLARALELHGRIRTIERDEIGSLNYALERLRLRERGLELDGVRDPGPFAALVAERQRLEAAYQDLQSTLEALHRDIDRDRAVFQVMGERTVTVPLAQVVRAYRPNAMGPLEKSGLYLARLWEFVSGEPREANTEGGVFPAIFGTVMMVIIMAVLVTPFGVVAAVYLREYAHQGTLTRVVRIAVNNLAGVPSIVYGVFGLGFFVYFIGGGMDRVFFREGLPAPTFGTPGIFWASLTLALLTLPVVIVATEEGLARIPRSVREGSLALGATRSETLWRTILPIASPAMITGLILAVARAAGEVAPLMLVGVVKLAPSLPLDGNFPYLHLERKFMHLGFHIYDVGFQSPNVEAARPLVYATSFLLVLVILALNLTAIAIRNRLRERYKALES